MEEIKKLIEEKLSGVISEEDLKSINEALDNAANKINYTLSIPEEYKSGIDCSLNDYICKLANGYMCINERLTKKELTRNHAFSNQEIDNLPNQKFIQSLNKEVYKGE